MQNTFFHQAYILAVKIYILLRSTTQGLKRKDVIRNSETSITFFILDQLTFKLYNCEWIIHVFNLKVLFEQHLPTLHMLKHIIKAHVVKFWDRSLSRLVCLIDFFNTTLLQRWFILMEIDCLLQFPNANLSLNFFTKIVYKISYILY